MSKRDSTREVIRYLSAPRMSPYLTEAGGDRELALSLYHWNLQLAAAFHEVLAVVEVAIRNAIDQQLRVWNTTRGNDPSGVPYTYEWAVRPAAPLAGLLSVALGAATKRAAQARAGREPRHIRKHAPICHDDVLAQLSFGLWKKLLPPAAPKKPGLQRLWNNALVHAFPLAPTGSGGRTPATPVENLVYDRLDRLTSLRNRVAHMEPLLLVNVPARLTDSLSLLAYVSTPTRDWCAGISRVTEINNARPGS